MVLQLVAPCISFAQKHRPRFPHLKEQASNVKKRTHETLTTPTAKLGPKTASKLVGMLLTCGALCELRCAERHARAVQTDHMLQV